MSFHVLGAFGAARSDCWYNFPSGPTKRPVRGSYFAVATNGPDILAPNALGAAWGPPPLA